MFEIRINGGNILVNKCTVFYESWQMECCGKAFSIGDTVKWTVYETDCLDTPFDIGKIDYCYEAHTEWNQLLVLEGKVERIKILYYKYMPSEGNPKLRIPVSGKLVESGIAQGFEDKLDDMEVNGYVVLLSEYNLRPAEK